jgi:hypothetical protein
VRLAEEEARNLLLCRDVDPERVDELVRGFQQIASDQRQKIN